MRRFAAPRDRCSHGPATTRCSRCCPRYRVSALRNRIGLAKVMLMSWPSAFARLADRVAASRRRAPSSERERPRRRVRGRAFAVRRTCRSVTQGLFAFVVTHSESRGLERLSPVLREAGDLRFSPSPSVVYAPPAWPSSGSSVSTNLALSASRIHRQTQRGFERA